MTPDDHTNRPSRPLDTAERLAIVEELAATAVDVTCLDTQFSLVEAPAVIQAFGIRASSWSELGFARPIDGVAPDDRPSVVGLIGQARIDGAAKADVGFVDNGERGDLHVVDLTEALGVFVFVRGGTSSWVAASDGAANTTTPRRSVQHRDASAVFLWIDENLPVMLGWDRDDLVGTKAVELVHPDDVDRALEAWLAMLAGQSEPVRLRYRRADDQYRWFEVHNTNLLDDPERGHVETEMIDIDAEMQALARVRDSELQFASLAESLPVGVLQFDQDGEVVFANEWMQGLTGCRPQDMASLAWADGHREAIRARILETLETQVGVDFELPVVDSVGGLRACRLRIRPLTSSGGQRGAIASVEDITASLDLQQRLRSQALTDPLTDLPNRRALHDWLATQGTDDEVALFFIDLDHFKIINDALGHDVGDEFLVGVSQLIRGAVRPSDFVARLGGDEFVVGCRGIAGPDEAAHVAARVLHTLDQPVSIGGRPVLASCSIGIAVAQPGRAPTNLISDADLAMYEAKRSGGRRYAFYDEDQRRGVERQLRQEQDLRDAMSADQFELWFQPVVELATGRTFGYEALARWLHPDQGVLMPAQFIQVAERTGLIHPLGNWILQEACRSSAALKAGGRPGRVSVNVSPFQLANPSFTRAVLGAAADNGVDLDDLVIEVTESVFLEPDDDVLAALGTLVDAGAKVALDDFGTGYSSLNHLRRLPSQIVKIDRSYTAEVGVDSGTTAILQATVALARRLGQDLIVEGIETSEQARLLRAMGVRYGQGYLFGRPVPVRGLVDRPPARRLGAPTPLPDDRPG